MAVTAVDVDRDLLERALRGLLAARQKPTMLDGIAELSELPAGLGAPVVRSGTRIARTDRLPSSPGPGSLVASPTFRV
ncbi:hypothetical protein [Gordonia sp. DT101]|uniref:hypothetical protein n=1 Tax=Gordonia sp. DT101 TaxID=3416545 RepID=UPI003CF3BD91